jgi:hypothetical protein
MHVSIFLFAGHSLGGLLSEVATVESHSCAAAHDTDWQCTSFEGPGLPYTVFFPFFGLTHVIMSSSTDLPFHAGHSLGGLLSEVATVESHAFAAAHGADWHCTSFEGPGLPDLYHSAALRVAPVEHWNGVITSYLAAPNPINMLYKHLGSVVHVVVPWEQVRNGQQLFASAVLLCGHQPSL